jgi:hypothetical protein
MTTLSIQQRTELGRQAQLVIDARKRFRDNDFDSPNYDVSTSARSSHVLGLRQPQRRDGGHRDRAAVTLAGPALSKFPSRPLSTPLRTFVCVDSNGGHCPIPDLRHPRA